LLDSPFEVGDAGLGDVGFVLPVVAAADEVANPNARRLEFLLALVGFGLPPIAADDQLGDQNPRRRLKYRRRCGRTIHGVMLRNRKINALQ